MARVADFQCWGTMGYGLSQPQWRWKMKLLNEEVFVSWRFQFPNEFPVELGTLVQYGINVKTVIINNGWQGMVRQWR